MLGVQDPFTLAGKSWRSRLIVGTGKYKDEDETKKALAASGAEIVTVALRRIELKPGQPSLLDALKGYAILPNTAGCYTVDEAVRTARLARQSRSGATASCSHANIVPVRPKPVATSSQISSTPWRLQSSRTAAR